MSRPDGSGHDARQGSCLPKNAAALSDAFATLWQNLPSWDKFDERYELEMQEDQVKLPAVQDEASS